MIKPLGNRLLVKPIDKQEKIGNIYIPDSVNNEEQKAEVVAVGDGKKGQSSPCEVGQIIYYGKYVGSELFLNNKKHMVLNFDDVLGIEE